MRGGRLLAGYPRRGGGEPACRGERGARARSRGPAVLESPAGGGGPGRLRAGQPAAPGLRCPWLHAPPSCGGPSRARLGRGCGASRARRRLLTRVSRSSPLSRRAVPWAHVGGVWAACSPGGREDPQRRRGRRTGEWGGGLRGTPQLLGQGRTRGCGAPGVCRSGYPRKRMGRDDSPWGVPPWVGETWKGGGVCGQCSAVPAGEPRGSRGRGLLLLLGPAFPVVLAPVHGLGLRLPSRQVCVQQLRPGDCGQIPPQGKTGWGAREPQRGSGKRALPRVSRGSADPLSKVVLSRAHSEEGKVGFTCETVLLRVPQVCAESLGKCHPC